MNTYPDLGRLLLRLNLGCLLLLHGIYKLMHGVSGIEGMLTRSGLPAFIAYGVFVGEIIAPIMLILGVKTRIAALFALINMIVAILLVHTGQFGMLDNTGAWRLETQSFFFINALVIILLGAGKYSIDKN